MSVVFTLVVIAAAGAWVLAVFRRLSGLRDQVKQAWKRLEHDRSNEAIKTVYNKHVAVYNNALESFPANVIGPMAGFKAARRYEPLTSTN